MKIRYILLCALISLLVWGSLFLFVLKKELTVGLYKDFFEHKIARMEKSVSPRFFIIAGSNGLYSHDAETFEKKLSLPSTNLSMVAMFPLSYLFERYKPLFRPGDIVYLPVEYHNYTANDKLNSFGDVYDITIERSFKNLNIKTFYNSFSRFDLYALLESVVESGLAAKGFQRRVTVNDLTAYGDFSSNKSAAAEAYQAYLASLPRMTVGFSKTVPGLKDFLQWAAVNKITVIGGLPTCFDDTELPKDTEKKIEKFFTDNNALFVTASSRSFYPRTSFFDTPYHLQREIQIQHSAAVADALLKKYPEYFPVVSK